jgi:ligand-binding SRPBCC domain-containing protein
LPAALQDVYSWKTGAHDRLFYTEQWLPADVKEVSAFFSPEGSLQALGPPSLIFQAIDQTPPANAQGTQFNQDTQLDRGTQVNYRLKIRGLAVSWQHFHRLQPLAGGTLLIEQVVYRLPLGFLSRGPVAFLVRKDVEKIFRYRRRKLAGLFAPNLEREATRVRQLRHNEQPPDVESDIRRAAEDDAISHAAAGE